MNAIIVHGGKNYAPYISDCIRQFFLINNDSLLYCLVDTDFEELTKLQNKYTKLRIVLRKQLKMTLTHRFYLLANRSAYSNWRGGFWRYVVERFFLIQEFMHKYNEKNIIHFEYDNLIYANINEYENKLISFSNSTKILLPTDGDKRCIPGFVFIPNEKSLLKFCKFYNRNFTIHVNNDMIAFSSFMDKNPEYCASLPVVPEEYTSNKESMTSLQKITHYKMDRLSNGEKQLDILFDAAAFGQFVGGIDKRNMDDPSKSSIGFINPDAAYNVKDFNFEWKTQNGLRKPYIEFNNKQYPLFNLHIHSKNLNLYQSDIKEK